MRAHHGSLAREQRPEVEDALKAGRLRAIVATSSLELGIDMGAVDLVIQVESPGSVASGLQRIGRAGHQVGEPSRGKIFPKFRGDLLEAAVVTQRMLRRPDRGDALPAQPARRARPADRRDVRGRRVAGRRPARGRPPGRELRGPVRRRVRRGARPAGRALPERRVRGAATPRGVGPDDRARARARGRRRASPSRTGARSRTAACSACSCPTARASASSTRRWSTRAAAARCSCSGASSWRIEDITRDRSWSCPAPGEPGKMPFWKGDKPGRPLELGRAIGAFTRELGTDHRADSLDAAAGRRRARRARGREPGQVRGRSARGDRRRARRPHDRGRALPRRARRLARLHPVAVRLAGARAVGARDRGAAGRARRSRRAGPVERRRHRDPPPGGRGPYPARRPALRSRRDRGGGRPRPPGTALFACAFREASARALLLPRRRPGSAPRCGSSGSASPTCWPRPRSIRRSRCCSRPRASACATCSTCRRCAR